jgi:DNA-directed RNA polymerase specialized sigma24 family protein
MEESEAFLRREHASLTRAAYLLTGDVVAAQDLAQDVACPLWSHHLVMRVSVLGVW